MYLGKVWKEEKYKNTNKQKFFLVLLCYFSRPIMLHRGWRVEGRREKMEMEKVTNFILVETYTENTTDPHLCRHMEVLECERREKGESNIHWV